jgi:hypothetical protein
MRYSKSTVVDDRTLNYRFSIDSKTDIALTDLRAVVKIHNDSQRAAEDIKEPHYIRVRARGRGPYMDSAGNIYKKSIPDFLAVHWDVYVVRDTAAMKRYQARKAAGGMMSAILGHIEQLNKTINEPTIQAS